MQTGKFFWNYFFVTGNIGAYLIFREINKTSVMIPSDVCGLKKKKRLG